MINAPLWFSNLIFWSLQLAVLVLAAGLLPRLLSIRQPRVLLFYWRTILTLTLLLPALQPWHRAKPMPPAVESINFEPLGSVPPSIPVSHWQLPSLDSIAPIVGVVLLSGVALRLILLMFGLIKLRRLRRTSIPVLSLAKSSALLEQMRASLAVRAEFWLSPHVESPVTFGFSPPIVLLPVRFPSLDPRFQSAIACHELLHVRRRDWTHHLAEELLSSLLWFHPAVAWLISRIRLAREQVVDLEVVRISQERKTYLDALLEFTNVRALLAAIPAPPFLAERQLVERIALMIKEVRMSRRRLFVSLTTVACCLLLVTFAAVRLFPLKAAPRPAQDSVQKDVDGRVSGAVSGGIAKGIAGGIAKGIAGGVAEGISGGISGEVSKKGGTARGATQGRSTASSDVPDVDISTIWVDTVKRGPMLRQVRGLGTLVRADNSSDFIARVTLPADLAKLVQPNQEASVDTRKGIVKGRVRNVSAEITNGMATVDILLGTPRVFVFASDPIDATIDIEKLDDILQVGRPVHVASNTSASIFKIASDGKEAVRVVVRFGRASVSTIEVLEGLQTGDRIILSDTSEVGPANRIHLTNQMNPGKR
jgi:beta-lactamase regulating signal transducer with metallopeptidase domain